MQGKPNILIIESVGTLLTFLKNIVSARFTVISSLSFSKAKAFLDNTSIILSDFHNCDEQSWSFIEKISQDRPDIPIVLMVTDKEYQNATKIAGKIPLTYVKKPLDKARLLQICVDAVDKKNKKPEPAQPDAFDLLSVDLSSSILRSFNRKAVICLGKKLTRNRLEIVADDELRPGTEVIFSAAAKGHALKVEFCNPEEQKFWIGLKAIDDTTDLIPIFREMKLVDENAAPIEAKKEAAPVVKAPAVAAPPAASPAAASGVSTGMKITDGVPQKVGFPNLTLLIDDDDFIRGSIEKVLQENGMQNTVGAADGLTAWQEAVRKKFDFIILDWVLPKLDGKALINRFRNHFYYKDIPILVISGFANKQDFNILKDFPLVAFLEKPYQVPELVKQISKLFLQHQQWIVLHKNAHTYIKNIKDWKDPNAQKGLITFVSQGNEAAYYAYVCAMALVENGIFEPAQMLFKMARQSKDLAEKVDCAIADMEVTRHNFAGAKVVLSTIYKNSPSNTAMLAHYARASLEEQQIDQAKKYFSEIIRIDQQSVKGVTGVKISSNIKAWMMNQKPGEIPAQFTTLLNTVGVDLVRKEQLKEGIEHYQAALHHVTDPVTKAKLAYNLALAFKKSGETSQALSWFEKAVQFDASMEGAKRQIEALQKEGVKSAPVSTGMPLTTVTTVKAAPADSSQPFINRRMRHKVPSKLATQKLSLNTEEEPHEKVRRACPSYPEFAKYMTEQHVNVAAESNRLLQYIAKFGAPALNASLRKMVADNVPSWDYLLDILRNKKYGKITQQDVRESVSTILLIDNDDRFAQTLGKELAGSKIDALAESSLKAAFKVLEDKKNVRLLLVGSELSDMDGLKAVYEIKSRTEYANLPIIMIMQSFDQRKMSTAASVGCEDFYSKTQDISQLVEKIQSLVL